MGVSIMYNAIPLDSRLYQRIQTEKPLCYLVNNLTTYGGGLFSFFEDDPFNEAQEILDALVEDHPTVFGTKSEADAIISDYRAELDHTRQNYPGIETRTALIEQSFDDIEQCLIQEFSQRQIPEPDEMVRKLLLGDQSLAPNLLTRADDPIDLVSYDLVQAGAKILASIDPEQLPIDVPGWADWGVQHFKVWHELYLMASEHKDVILISSE